MAFFVRQYRNLLPTNSDFLAMTHSDIVKEYWDIHYWEVRKKAHENADSGDETVQYESEIVFEQEMAQAGLAKVGGKWVEVDPSELEE